MQSVQNEKLKLQESFQRLEAAIEKYAASVEEKTKAKANILANQEAEGLRDEIRVLQTKLTEAKQEISQLSMDLVRLKDENKKLREINSKIEKTLSESIREIEELVA